MRIVFMGTPSAAVPTLERLVGGRHDIVAVYTQPDRPSGRGRQLSMPAVKERALELGLQVLQPTKIKTPEALDTFRSHAADAAVVVAYGRILPIGFLEAFRYGAINLHFSLLPKYRGAAPVNWAIACGETETGITTMKMDEGLDTGPILRQDVVAIGEDETAIGLMARLADRGAELLLRTLSDIDMLEPSAQNDANATYAPILRKSDGQIDWTMDAVEIRNRVRGFQPFPTSFTFLDDKKLTIWECTVGKMGVATPGTVTRASGHDLDVACGNGTTLLITELQIEGKRRVSATEFINGYRIAEGTIFENRTK